MRAHAGHQPFPADAVKDKKIRWYELAAPTNRRLAVQRKLHLTRLTGEWWMARLCEIFRCNDLRTPGQRKVFLTAVQRMADDRELADEFEAITRLGDQAKARAWVRAAFGKPRAPPLSPEEKLARRLDGKAKASEARERRARAKLAEAEEKLARVKKQHARWKKKVDYYDRKARGE